MPLFLCSGCGCIDNTALAIGKERLGYWGHEENPLCSFCLNGKWHDKFNRRKWDGKEEIMNSP